MTIKKLFCLAACTLLCAGSASLKAQFTLSGAVKNEQGEAVPFALVTINNTQRALHANEDGSYSFTKLPAGNYVVSAVSVGFARQIDSVNLQNDQQHNFVLISSNKQLDEVVVNATRVDDNSGMAFSNMDAQTIQKQNLGQDAPFVLQQLTGVVVNSDAGNGVGYTGLRIRGSDATRVNITINGVPVNDAESQGTFWVNMPDLLSSVNSIQVQRGVGASSNGAGAFGATINMETNQLNEKPYAQLISTAGSYNTFRNTVAAGTGLLNNRFVLDARASAITSDGYIDRAYSNLNSYYLSAAYYGKKSVVKLINFRGNEKTYQAWNLVPEDSVKNGNRRYNEIGSYTDENGNKRYYENQTDNYMQNNYQLHFIKHFNNRLHFNLIGHYTKGRGYYEEYKEGQDFERYGMNEPQLMLPDSTFIQSTDLIRRRWLDNDFVGGIFNLSYRPSADLSFTLGGGYNTYYGKHFGRVMWARYASNSEIDHEYYLNTANKNDANVYLKANWRATGKLNLFADLQHRRVDYSYLGPDNSDTLSQQLQVFNFFNPKLGLSYDLNTHINLYGSAAVGNKEPNRNDFIENRPDNQPKHEQMLDIEAGCRFTSSDLRILVNFYNMQYKNQLVLNGEINDVGASKRINVPVSFRRGIEFELSYRFSSLITLAGNVAYSKNKIVNFDEYVDHYASDYSYLGNLRTQTHQLTDISFSPDLVSSVQLLISPVKGLELAFIHKYVGRQFLDNTSTISRSIDPYGVMDFRLNWKLRSAPDLTLMLGVYNLLNKKYETNGYTFGWYEGAERITYNYLAPAAPVNFLAGFSLKF